MRIISSFKDYYDAVMKSGMDKEIVYVREKKEIDIKPDYELGYINRYSRDSFVTSYHLLGYCGQIYHVVKTHDTKLNKSKFLFGSPDTLRPILIKKDRYIWTYDKGKLFLEQNLKSVLEIFHKHQVPLFLLSADDNSYKKQKLILNPYLKDIGFHKIKDTYTAYQDIFQFVAGTLNRPENKMVKISDKIKAEKHGFDKWSFKKLPTKRK